MIQLEHKLEKPFYSKEKRKYSSEIYRALLDESQHKCNLCGVTNNDLKDNKKTNLEIAHIYGLRNFTKVNHDNKLFHIFNSNQLNGYGNLIILCKDCHQKYDKNPTYKKYVEMVNLKKKITNEYHLREYIYNELSNNRNEIIKICTRIKINDIKFDYNVMYFDNKMKYNKINIDYTKYFEYLLTNYVGIIDDYYSKYYGNDMIKLLKFFSDMYINISKIEKNKNILLSIMLHDNNLKALQDKINTSIFEALIVYMIWKCEVLEKYDISK